MTNCWQLIIDWLIEWFVDGYVDQLNRDYDLNNDTKLN